MNKLGRGTVCVCVCAFVMYGVYRATRPKTEDTFK